MAVRHGIFVALREALDAPEATLKVRDLVRSELEDGVSRSEVLGQLESLRIELRGAGQEAAEDVVLDVMDFVGGWSGPHVRV
jgi:hypothetical protein